MKHLQGIMLASNPAPVHEFRCLCTSDLRRKQKRWQDRFPRFHTFNKTLPQFTKFDVFAQVISVGSKSGGKMASSVSIRSTRRYPSSRFRYLYTSDLRRKQKRWQDGFLHFHMFDKRITVHEAPSRNYISDKHYSSLRISMF